MPKTIFKPLETTLPPSSCCHSKGTHGTAVVSHSDYGSDGDSDCGNSDCGDSDCGDSDCGSFGAPLRALRALRAAATVQAALHALLSLPPPELYQSSSPRLPVERFTYGIGKRQQRTKMYNKEKDQ